MTYIEICIVDKYVSFREKDYKFRGFITRSFLIIGDYVLGINSKKQIKKGIIENFKKKPRSVVDYLKAIDTNCVEVIQKTKLDKYNFNEFHKLRVTLDDESPSLKKLKDFIKTYYAEQTYNKGL